jgi:hypothetical protein
VADTDIHLSAVTLGEIQAGKALRFHIQKAKAPTQ